MGMPPCTRCGQTDRFRMIGLMSRWFALPAGLPLEGGYFYLCPACFDELIQPHWEQIVDGLLERQRPAHMPVRATEGQPESAAASPTLDSAAPSTPEPDAEPGPRAAD